jgi:AcrR family transcriptional regulator
MVDQSLDINSMPKIVDTEQYRKALLYKCFDLLAEKGYANVTTRQISKVLGISTGAMYHYFPSKKVLFEQLVEEMSRQDVLMLETAAAGADTLSERLLALGQFLLEHEDYFVGQARIWADFYQQTDPQEILANPVFQQVDARYQQVMAAILGLSDVKVVRLVWTLINGVLIEQLGGRDSQVFRDQIDLLMQMLIAYFEKQAGV